MSLSILVRLVSVLTFLYGLAGVAIAQADRVHLPDLCTLLREKGANPNSMIKPRALPHDSRLVIFAFDKNALYPVYTAFNSQTHLEFASGEKIIGSYVNDSTQFEQKVAVTGSDIFIRPRVRGATGSMTVITNRQRYQIELLDVSNCPKQTRYQRVSWQSDPGVSDGFYENATVFAPSSNISNTEQPTLRENSHSDMTPDDTVEVSRLNMDYAVEGSDQIKPVRVFDDVHKTWIQFGKNMPLRPALFAIDEQGTGSTVDYAPRANAFVVPRVFEHGALLKLGKAQVHIRNKASCGFWGCQTLKSNNIKSPDYTR